MHNSTIHIVTTIHQQEYTNKNNIPTRITDQQEERHQEEQYTNHNNIPTRKNIDKTYVNKTWIIKNNISTRIIYQQE